MQTPCLVCGTLVAVSTGGRCPRHRLVSPQRKLRSTQAWTTLSRRVRSSRRCAMCGESTLPELLEADHVIPVSVRPDLAFDPSNVRALCKPCHKRRNLYF